MVVLCVVVLFLRDALAAEKEAGRLRFRVKGLDRGLDLDRRSVMSEPALQSLARKRGSWNKKYRAMPPIAVRR